MLYHDLCYTCINRKEFVDVEIEEAREFNLDHGCSWIFPCGASYSKRHMNTHGVEIIPNPDCLDNKKGVYHYAMQFRQRNK